MIGKTDFDLFSKEHAEQAYADEQTIMRTGRMIKKEERETWSDRSDTWAYSIKMPLTDKAGNIIGTFGISRDITDLKRIEEKLAWEQSLLQALLDTSSDHIYFKDREGRFIRNSNAHAKLLGLSDTSEMIGKTDFDFFTPEHAKMAYEDEREIMETGRTLKKEETNLTASGPGVWVSMEKMPLRDAKGGVIGTFGISRDITERKRMEDMLAHEQYLLQTLMDNSSDNIYFKDLDSQFTRISKAQARYVGLDNVSDMIGKSDFDFFTIEHASRSYKDEQTIIRTGQAIRIEEENEKIGGVASWFLTEKMPLKSREGRIIGTFGISRNITERKQDEERIKNLLMEQMRAKSQTSETQDVTIYALAHLAELRDLETGKHLERTANYIRILAEELTRLGTFKGYLTPEYINGLFKSAPLHDIGKVGVPDAILLKPGRLSREELAVMQKHCELGARLLSSAEQKLKFQSFLNIAVQLTIGHHEKWNGTGYPSGLSCEQIPLSARLMGLADVYDALRSKRPYKEPFEHGDCVRIIKDERGRHFDPRIVDAFLNRELEFRKVSDEMAD
jgi:PAS domain S-box-containing protein